MLTFQYSLIACSLYLCILCICFVLYTINIANCEWPEFYVHKNIFCSVLKNQYFQVLFKAAYSVTMNIFRKIFFSF